MAEIGGINGKIQRPLSELPSSKELADAITFPLYLIDIQSRHIVFANEAARASGITASSPCFSVVHDCAGACAGSDARCPIEEVVKTNAPVVVEHIHKGRGGRPKIVEVYGFPVRHEGLIPTAVMVYCVDISERRASEEIRKRYEFVVNSAKEYMVLVNRDYCYEAVNTAYCQAHGISEMSEIVGRSVADVCGAERFTAIRHFLDECFSGREMHHEEWLNFPAAEGYYDVRYYPYRDAGGRVTHAVVVIHDITTRKLAEDALRSSEEKFSKVFRHSPDRIAIISLKDGRYVDVNEAFVRWSGYPREDVLGRTSVDLDMWVDVGQRADFIDRITEKGSVQNLEVLLRTATGEVRAVLLSAEVIEFGGEPCVISIGRDITERKMDEDALRQEVSSLKERFLSARLQHEEAFSHILTNNPKMRALFQYVEVIASSPHPVLVTGETGVGKELIARVIHAISGRRGKFVALNVAGLDDNLFSDTLFGHSKGAYTGAEQHREGLISQAAAGTLFLDEIGDLSETSQVKLLRLVQEGTYYPLGSDVSRKSDARIIVATNRDVGELLATGKFRKDLYFRLRGHQIHVPPLRERKGDIRLLLVHFIEEAAISLGKKRPPVSPEVIPLLEAYDFPGNVRELKTMAYDAVARHRSGMLSPASFRDFIGHERAIIPPPSSVKSLSQNVTLSTLFGRLPTLKEIDELLIREALEQAHGNQGIAASLLGMTRQALNKRLLRNPRLKSKSDT